MAVYSCSLFRNSFPWLAALCSFIAYANSSGFGLLTILLTSSALILCPVIVSRSKSTSCREVSHRLSTDQQIFLEPSLRDEARNTVNNECSSENVSDRNEAASNHETEEVQVNKKKEDNKKVCDCLLSSSDAVSDSESADNTSSSEDSENDWVFRENLSHSTPCSDGSISDEESLIEIALPTGHYVDPKRVHQEQQQSWYGGFQQQWSDCSIESHFRYQTWMEMLNEMNEENLIEIDIGMGSIKYSRFEIEA